MKEQQLLDCILLVDDDEVTNFVNESLITDVGMAQETLVAKNGREAIGIIQEKKFSTKNCPQLILLDINMPVMNGFEFLEAYQQLEEELRKSVIVVMLTSSLNPDDVEHAKQGGANEFLDKPLTIEKLKKIVTKHFQ